MKALQKCMHKALVFSLTAAVSLVSIPFVAPHVSADTTPVVGYANSIQSFENNASAWTSAGANTTYTWGFTTDSTAVNPETGSTRAEIIQGAVGATGANTVAVNYWMRDQMLIGAGVWDGVRVWLKSGCGQDIRVNVGFQFDNYGSDGTNDDSSFNKKNITVAATATTQGSWCYFDLASLGLPARAFKFVTNFQIQAATIGSFNPRSNFVIYMDDFQGYCKAAASYTLNATTANTTVSGGTKLTGTVSGVSCIAFSTSDVTDTLSMNATLANSTYSFPACFPAGTYTVILHTADSNTRGYYTTSVNGSVVGSPVNFYAAGSTAVAGTHTIGNVTLPDGSPTFQFTPSGTKSNFGICSVELQPVATAVTSYTTALSVSNGAKSLVVAIHNAASDHTYQIWSYNDLGSDVLGELGNEQYQWVLQKAKDDNTNPFTITDPTPDASGNYRVMVVDFDASGNVAATSYDSDILTPDDLQVAKIRKILVNGKTVGGTQVINASSDDAAAVSFRIDAVNATDSGYSLSYSVDGRAETPVYVGADGTATVNFKNFALNPGTYTFTAGAKGQNGSTDTQQVVFKVCSSAPVTYPEIGDMAVKMDGAVANQADLTLTGLTDPGNGTFHYSFVAGEPGGTALVKSGMLENVPNSTSLRIPQGKYGCYAVYGYVGRDASSLDDDSVLRYVDYKRTQGSVKLDSVSVTGSDTPGTGNHQTATVGGTCQIKAVSAADLGSEATMYSFWRCDASGWVLLKGWSKTEGADTLTWKPAYAGNYIIQVRVKGENAGSYEDCKNVDFSISYPAADSKNVASEQVTMKVQGQAVTNGVTLTDVARTPVTLGATVQNTADNLLYRFDVADSNQGTMILRAYSPDSTCTWVPRKKGSYQITVKIINQNSFGMYDQFSTQTVTVD